MQLSWPKLKPYVIQGALIAAMLLVGWFGGGTLLRHIAERQDHIQELAVLAENRQRQMGRLPELQSQYDFITANEQQLDLILSKDEIVDFIRTLERMAAEMKVRIEIDSRDNALLESKISASAKDTKEGKETPSSKSEAGESPTPAKKTPKKETGLLGELPFPNYLRLSITVTGPYLSVVGYLHKLETLPLALDVIGLQLHEHAEESNNRSTPGVGFVSPFSTTVLPGVAPTPEPTPSGEVVLDAEFDTVIYLKNP